MLRADDACGDGDFELEVLRELSRARSDPGAVAESIRNRLSHFKGRDYFPPDRGGRTAVVTKEGQAAVRDAIRYLEGSPRLPPLAEECVQGLRLAAEDHLLDLGTRGAVGHEGADGTSSSERIARYGSWSGKCGECLWFGREGASARQIVEDLIVDDGVPSRGHRLGIYDPAFRVAGVRLGNHKTFGSCCVIEFASEYMDDDERQVERVVQGPRRVAAGAPVKTQWQNLGQCPGCGETIHGGSVIEALGRKWHKDCFACQGEGCGKPLRGVPYQEHDGMPFCKDCYYNRFGEVCAGCGERIHGGTLNAMGKKWHRECFVCSACSGPLESRYATRDGRPLCGSCCQVPTGPEKGLALSPGDLRGVGAGRRQRTPPPIGSKAPPPVGRTPPGRPPPSGRNTPPPIGHSTPPPSGRGGAPKAKATLPKIGAGRGVAKSRAAPKVAIGTAKKTTESLIMNYSDLC